MTHRYIAPRWSLELASGWTAEPRVDSSLGERTEFVAITPETGDALLRLTVDERGLVPAEEWTERVAHMNRAKGRTVSAAQCGEFRGWLVEFVSDDEWLRGWALHADARYELQLEARVAGVVLFDWASQGQIDAAGIAPERFALRRRGRDRQAVNFQRDAGKITFSGPTHELPLLAGAQDRLSWLLQLAAVVAAAPEHFGRGAKLVLFVAGARGDADVWTFVVQGVEVQDETPALKLLREPRRLYDTRAEVWLDPAEHYLPIRVLQTPSGGGAALDLIREREAR